MIVKDVELCKQTYEMTKEELAAYAKAQADAKLAVEQIFQIIRKENEVMEKFKDSFKAVTTEEREYVKAIECSVKLTKSAIEDFEQNYIDGFYAECGQIFYTNIETSQDWIDRCQASIKNSNKKEFDRLKDVLKMADGKTDMREEVRRLVPQTFANMNANKQIKMLTKKANMAARREAKLAEAKEREAKQDAMTVEAVQVKPMIKSREERIYELRMNYTLSDQFYADTMGVARVLRKSNPAKSAKIEDYASTYYSTIFDKRANGLIVKNREGDPVYGENQWFAMKEDLMDETTLERLENTFKKASYTKHLIDDVMSR